MLTCHISSSCEPATGKPGSNSLSGSSLYVCEAEGLWLVWGGGNLYRTHHQNQSHILAQMLTGSYKPKFYSAQFQMLCGLEPSFTLSEPS